MTGFAKCVLTAVPEELRLRLHFHLTGKPAVTRSGPARAILVQQQCKSGSLFLRRVSAKSPSCPGRLRNPVMISMQL